MEKSVQGVALITVLLTIFLASMAAVGLTTLQHTAIRRTTIVHHQQQARLYALGIEQWARLVLQRDRQNSTLDHPGEEWAYLPLTLWIENGRLSGTIRDLHGCFNLNNLWQPPSAAHAAGRAQHQSFSSTPGVGRNIRRPSDEDEMLKEKADTKSIESRNTISPSSQNSSASSSASSPQRGAEGIELDQGQVHVLQRLLTRLELKPELAQAIIDWTDSDSEPLFPDGAEDGEYTVRDPPYLAANQLFTDVSELRLIKGIDLESYNKLASVMCALPSGTALNVNTAPGLVLAALSDEIDQADLERLLENRPVEGYKSVDEFLDAIKITVDAPTKALLDVTSRYFLVEAIAQVGEEWIMLTSTLFRDEQGVRVLRRTFGKPDKLAMHRMLKRL